jgi:TRAP-type C4-dicarboxylate transport system substrate-binding protein
MPFLYADEKKAHAVLDGEAGQKLMMKLESNFAVGMETPPLGYPLFVGSAISGLPIE